MFKLDWITPEVGLGILAVAGIMLLAAKKALNLIGLDIAKKKGSGDDEGGCPDPDCHDSHVRDSDRVKQLIVSYSTLSSKIDQIQAKLPVLDMVQVSIEKLANIAKENAQNINYMSGRIDEALKKR